MAYAIRAGPLFQLIQRFGALAGVVKRLKDDGTTENVELRVPVWLAVNATAQLHVRRHKMRIMPKKHTSLRDQDFSEIFR
jgi:hypothetical protein